MGFYPPGKKNLDFRKAKVQFVHELVKWSGLDKLPQGSRILDVGCGIGGSSRIPHHPHSLVKVLATLTPRGWIS